jgi:RNA polymerase sigma factor (TIGR02999 family)
VNHQVANSHEITELLQAWSRGDSEALAKLIPLADRELRKIAHSYMRKERPGHILQTTALVDEALMRLLRAQKISWENRKQFYGLIAYRMRQILVDCARKQITRSGTRVAQVNVSEADQLTCQASEELLRLHQAMIKLATLDERKAKVVEQHYFGGFTFAEIAKLLGVAKPTVERDWNFARRWLHEEIYGDEALKSSEA